jgi:hypothetical protein
MGLNPLDHAVLTYEPIWGEGRRLLGARLHVRLLDGQLDVPHLLHAIADWWFAGAPMLLVNLGEERLLRQAMAALPPDHLWLEIPDFGASIAPSLLQAIAQARRLGHRLVQNLPLAPAPVSAPQAATHFRYLLRCWPESPSASPGAATVDHPALPGQLLTGVRSVRQAADCLDARQAWGLVGWPLADALAQAKHRGVDRPTLLRVQQALLHDAPLERVLHTIHSDPVLTYRLLALVNSDAWGATRPMGSVRQAIVLLGERRFRDALLRLLRDAVLAPDLLPVRHSVALRAQLMQTLMDAGAQQALANDIMLTGLFSGLVPWLDEPLANALERVPVSEDVVQALLAADGPYAPYLAIATRLADPAQTEWLPALCEQAGFALGDVNLALLKTLARWRSP